MVCDDPRAKVLGNTDSWRQTNMLLHQNVIAILAAVRSTGGHVLWVYPPFSFAFQWDFVQDFLSNIATLWPWVDSCQFDINVCKLWLLATSSQGLLPLAPQRNPRSLPNLSLLL